MTLYEAFTGEHPYEGAQFDAAEIIWRDAPRLDDDWECSSEFRLFLTACLQVEMEQRPKIDKLIVGATLVSQSLRVTCASCRKWTLSSSSKASLQLYPVPFC